jgi:glucose/arabinose dehydrogenase
MQTLRLQVYLSLLFFFFSLNAQAKTTDNIIYGNAGSKLIYESFGKFNEPWAMTFLPNGELLVTEKRGTLFKVNLNKLSRVSIKNIPKVAYGGQGGLGDIILHPKFNENQIVYISYAKKDSFGNKGAVVAMARFTGSKLENLKIIWRQKPKVSGSGHYSHRLAISPDGYLFIASGERQKQKPAQSFSNNLGKIIRLNLDGSIPRDNPFKDKGKIAKSFWTMGHRNILGIAFDSKKRLWTHEMGPRHGDEFNLIIKGDNYGWPIVSWGDQYSGIPIPDHDTRPEFHTPEVYWVPTIAPSGMIIYNGSMFPKWKDNALIGGLRSRSLIRVKIKGVKAWEAERFSMEKKDKRG